MIKTLSELCLLKIHDIFMGNQGTLDAWQSCFPGKKERCKKNLDPFILRHLNFQEAYENNTIIPFLIWPEEWDFSNEQIIFASFVEKFGPKAAYILNGNWLV